MAYWWSACGGRGAGWLIGCSATSKCASSLVESRGCVWKRGYQIAQSLFSLGAGGFSAEVGGGSCSTVPAVHTDFVFSSLAEELGLLGSGAVLFLYLFLVMRTVRAALLANDEFLQLLTIGIGSLFAIQAIVIIGGVIKMIPMTGITMPFISYGGSSLISSYLLVGAILGISHGG